MNNFRQLKGKHVAAGGYVFNQFSRLSFDLFDVYCEDSAEVYEILISMINKEVEISTISDCEIYSSATVRLRSHPEKQGDELVATFEVEYYYDNESREMKPKGGYLHAK